jgi:hypothetical protein
MKPVHTFITYFFEIRFGSLAKIGQLAQKLKGAHTDPQTDSVITYAYFFAKEEYVNICGVIKPSGNYTYLLL